MAIKILVADDQLHMLRLMEHQLKKDGYRLIEARDGEEVLETALRETPDLVILDVLMPKMDGLTALRRLKKNKATRGLPVIVLTASADEMTRQEAEFSGADVILTKPFSPTLLRQEIRRLISARQSEALRSGRSS
jgi:CheY-like chemotaxis protein